MNAKDIKSFQDVVLHYFSENGRNLPWRKPISPYRIFVSEMMLQQTQVDRVLPKYKSFIQKFPSFKSLADASLTDVLTHWSGLGYNRRAKYLHESAKIISINYRGRLPKDIVSLEALPGIGSYTAGAIFTFVYNEPAIFIETNIRTVFIHTFFSNKENISDKDIFRLIEETLYSKDPRTWYWALMDYGSFIKKAVPNPNRKSKHHVQQTKFKGSDRQIRGEIVKLLLSQHETLNSIYTKLPTSSKKRVNDILDTLIKDKLIVREKGIYRIR